MQVFENSHSKITQILVVSHHSEQHALYYLAIVTGIRQGESF